MQCAARSIPKSGRNILDEMRPMPKLHFWGPLRPHKTKGYHIGVLNISILKSNVTRRDGSSCAGGLAAPHFRRKRFNHLLKLRGPKLWMYARHAGMKYFGFRSWVVTPGFLKHVGTSNPPVNERFRVFGARKLSSFHVSYGAFNTRHDML